MDRKVTYLVAAFAVCVLMMAGSAWAQGRGHGRGMSGANQGWHADNDRHGWRGGDWNGDRSVFGYDQRPRGWDKGRKTGWGDCDVPPGQAKKVGCSPTSRVFGGYVRHRDYIRHDRDRDRDRDRYYRHSSSYRDSRYRNTGVRRNHR